MPSATAVRRERLGRDVTAEVVDGGGLRRVPSRRGRGVVDAVFAEKTGAAEDPETARIRAALRADVSAETPGAIAWDVSAETCPGGGRRSCPGLLPAPAAVARWTSSVPGVGGAQLICRRASASRVR
jgi:hypothetical protein